MSNEKVAKVLFDVKEFKRYFNTTGMTYGRLSVLSKVSESTIFKALSEGCMTIRTYELLSKYVKIKITGSIGYF